MTQYIVTMTNTAEMEWIIPGYMSENQGFEEFQENFDYPSYKTKNVEVCNDWDNPEFFHHAEDADYKMVVFASVYATVEVDAEDPQEAVYKVDDTFSAPDIPDKSYLIDDACWVPALVKYVESGEEWFVDDYRNVEGL